MILVRKPKNWEFLRKMLIIFEDVVIFILYAKINDVWKIVFLFTYKWWFSWNMRIVEVLKIIVKNVDIVLKWLNGWDYSKCGNFVVPWMNWNKSIYIHLEKLYWNENENFDHNGNIVWKYWKWKKYCIVLLIIALAYQFIW